MTMPSVLSGVVTSRSSVCFSRSSEIAPVVKAGASTSTSSVSTSSSPPKMPWPMPADSAVPLAERLRVPPDGQAREVARNAGGNRCSWS